MPLYISGYAESRVYYYIKFVPAYFHFALSTFLFTPKVLLRRCFWLFHVVKELNDVLAVSLYKFLNFVERLIIHILTVS